MYIVDIKNKVNKFKCLTTECSLRQETKKYFETQHYLSSHYNFETFTCQNKYNKSAGPCVSGQWQKKTKLIENNNKNNNKKKKDTDTIEQQREEKTKLSMI